jgi:hypothetical protein
MVNKTLKMHMKIPLVDGSPAVAQFIGRQDLQTSFLRMFVGEIW